MVSSLQPDNLNPGSGAGSGVGSGSDDPQAFVGSSAGDGFHEPQARRIYQLEQALDQAMLYLEDLRQRTHRQEDLEAQLAIAQDYTYVQERAILSLKGQLDVLQAQADARPSDEVTGKAASSPEASPYPASPIDRDAARWRQEALELQTQCTDRQNRCQSLERQISELQEQILQQAKQAGEDETAIHFWKTQYRLSQQRVDQIRLTLEEQDGLPDDVVAALQLLLEAIDQASDQAGDQVDQAPALEPGPLLELPDFLIRRQYYRNRQLLRDSKLG